MKMNRTESLQNNRILLCVPINLSVGLMNLAHKVNSLGNIYTLNQILVTPGDRLARRLHL